MTRRGLFGLIPAPFTGGLGLLTTIEQPKPAPDNDPVAEAALAVDYQLGVAHGMRELIRRAHVRHEAGMHDHHDFVSYIKDLEGLHRHVIESSLPPTETRLLALLGKSPGLAVEIEGRVYTAKRSSRSTVLVEPVRVAMLTPKEGVL